MKLICDLCGSALTESAEDQALCPNCGLEYGPERLRELKAAQPKPQTPQKTKPQNPQKNQPQKANQKQNSGCGVWLLLAVGALDLVVGTHGIVAAFCIIILVVMLLAKK